MHQICPYGGGPPAYDEVGLPPLAADGEAVAQEAEGELEGPEEREGAGDGLLEVVRLVVEHDLGSLLQDVCLDGKGGLFDPILAYLHCFFTFSLPFSFVFLRVSSVFFFITIFVLFCYCSSSSFSCLSYYFFDK